MYTYDALARQETLDTRYPNKGISHSESFGYNPRSELTNALPDEASYTPYGTVTAEGDVTQPLQWSSEVYDPELALIYYNYRYYKREEDIGYIMS